MADLPLRPEQQRILAYPGKRLGVSAVPGSGKTFTLARLTASIIARNELADDQEVLIVTLVNAAVDNFDQRVRSAMPQQRSGLLPRLDYRVRTLHGLAHDLIRERPDLAGLDSRFQIVDDREAVAMLRDAAQAWLRSHPDALDEYLDEDMDEAKADWVRREQLPGLLQDVAGSVIRFAKDHFNMVNDPEHPQRKRYAPLDPQALLERVGSLRGSLPLAQACLEIYANYQDALAYRGAVDFDDLVRLALRVLKSDPSYVERLRHRWPYILEDEAQDSSSLQQEILEELAGDQSVWVRVGDPNQAIYQTFTTANPKYLVQFGKDYHNLPLSVSSRSTPSIIQLANRLIEWAQTEHPTMEARDALIWPEIRAASPDDPFPNPPDEPQGIRLVNRKYSPDEEIQAVADSLARWLPENPDRTVAVLAARNERAFKLVDELRRRKIDFEDSLLRSSSGTRFSAGALANILHYLSDPQSSRRLATVYRVWRREDRDDDQKSGQIDQLAKLLEKCNRVEDYLWPGPEVDWLEQSGLNDDNPAGYEELLYFRELVRRWQAAVTLPVDQVLLAVAQDLLHQPAELALAHKLAALLHRAGSDHPDWRLPELTEELAGIARNERRFLGFSAEDSGFDPERYKGRVVVATMHKAKGLEWDRVYLMSVNNYDFPSGQAHDTYMSEKWFLRGRLNLEAEALSQVRYLEKRDEYQGYLEGEETQRARLDYIRERLRLLYVGITRAKRQLIITTNAGRGQAQPAAPLVALQEWWTMETEGKV